MASLDQCRVPAQGGKKMKRHAVLITNDKIECIEGEGDILEFARKHIGCDTVELVGINKHKGLLVDEEGWLKPNYLNLPSSFLARVPIGGHAILVHLGPSSIEYLNEEFAKEFTEKTKKLIGIELEE